MKGYTKYTTQYLAREKFEVKNVKLTALAECASCSCDFWSSDRISANETKVRKPAKLLLKMALPHHALHRATPERHLLKS